MGYITYKVMTKTDNKFKEVKVLLIKGHPELADPIFTQNFIINYLCEFFIQNVELKRSGGQFK